MDRLHLAQLGEAAAFAPLKKQCGGAGVGGAGVGVAHVDGEEFEEAERGPYPAPAISADIDRCCSADGAKGTRERARRLIPPPTG